MLFLDAIASLEPGSWVGWLVGELVKNSIIRISRYILTNTDSDQVILTLTEQAEYQDPPPPL